MDIDWHVPWLAHLPTQCRSLTTNELPKQLNAILPKQPRLCSGLGQPIAFVPQDSLPNTTAYESHIAKTGNIPTRDNEHDLFNACVWLTFPKTKALLNEYQHQQIEHAGIKKRTKLRDAITLFDENGAILVTCESNISDALCCFDWQNSLVTPRAVWDIPSKPTPTAQAAVYVFGHALMEQLVEPRKPLCSHTWVILVSPGWFAQSTSERMCSLDELLKDSLQKQIDSDELHTRSYQPLPILGVPHFWDENANAEFYDDAFVFRSGRRKVTAT